ncbi:MAG TPA: ABC transporter ATP-binding protein [Chloroflexota bacterium]|nr:ABC transporter ATP-binding protein [Chloroflexota bacterium]
MSASTPAVLSIRDLTKRFGPVLANDGIDLEIGPGEIHALLGENGAGKTTLMNVLFGLVEPDAGTILLRGEPYRPTGPSDAIRAGIGMVHQHFMLIPTFTVVENVVLGSEPTGRLTLDLPTARADLATLSERFGLNVDPDALVRDLPVGVQQRVEILKALYRQADVLILDEPTAVLAPPEVEQLFEVMRGLAAGGRSIIFISHKLREVLSVADHVTVLRRGQVVGTVRPDDATEQSLATMMVGRPVDLVVEKAPATPREEILRVDGLRVLDQRGSVVVDGVDLTVRGGEIVGLAGVEGNGQTELVEALAGLRSVRDGRVTIVNADLTGASPRDLAEHGVSHIPEDRHRYGLVLAHSLADNLVLSRYDRQPFARWFRRMLDAVRQFAARLVAEYDVRTPSVRAQAATLSGGNQQKVVVARELSAEPRLLIAAQPTRGVDVGATELIHRRISAARDAGAAVLLISSELDELLAVADRLLVIYRGRITAELDTESVDREMLGLLIAGASRPSSG